MREKKRVGRESVKMIPDVQSTSNTNVKYTNSWRRFVKCEMESYSIVRKKVYVILYLVNRKNSDMKMKTDQCFKLCSTGKIDF